MCVCLCVYYPPYFFFTNVTSNGNKSRKRKYQMKCLHETQIFVYQRYTLARIEYIFVYKSAKRHHENVKSFSRVWKYLSTHRKTILLFERKEREKIDIKTASALKTTYNIQFVRRSRTVNAHITINITLSGDSLILFFLMMMIMTKWRQTAMMNLK